MAVALHTEMQREGWESQSSHFSLCPQTCKERLGSAGLFVGTVLPLSWESPKLFLEKSSRFVNPALPPKSDGSMRFTAVYPFIAGAPTAKTPHFSETLSPAYAA